MSTGRAPRPMMRSISASRSSAPAVRSRWTRFADRLFRRRRHEAQPDRGRLVGTDHHLPGPLGEDPPAEHRGPEPRQSREIVGVDDDVMQQHGHGGDSASSTHDRSVSDGSRPALLVLRTGPGGHLTGAATPGSLSGRQGHRPPHLRSGRDHACDDDGGGPGDGTPGRRGRARSAGPGRPSRWPTCGG